MSKPEVTVMIEDAKLVFINFSGIEKKYNAAGARNFGVILDPVNAGLMLDQGWNVKQLKDRELDGEIVEGDWYISVSVKFKGRPPRIVMIGSKNRQELTEDVVDQLDFVEMAHVDLILRQYEYDVNGNTGVKAYLKTMFVTIVEDELELKYAMGPGE